MENQILQVLEKNNVPLADRIRIAAAIQGKIHIAVLTLIRYNGVGAKDDSGRYVKWEDVIKTFIG